MEGINPLRNATSWISPLCLAHIDDQPIDRHRIQMRGFLSTIEGIDQSGSMGYMPMRSRICLDLACMVEELSSKYSQIWLAAMWGVCEESKRKFTMRSRMNDPTGPGVGLASHQRRRAFPTQSRRQLTAALRILVIQGGLTQGIGELGDLIETCLHVL